MMIVTLYWHPRYTIRARVSGVDEADRLAQEIANGEGVDVVWTKNARRYIFSPDPEVSRERESSYGFRSWEDNRIIRLEIALTEVDIEEGDPVRIFNALVSSRSRANRVAQIIADGEGVSVGWSHPGAFASSHWFDPR